MSFILASASPRRLSLLKQMGIVPDAVFSPEIDEAHHNAELPKAYAIRMAQQKVMVAKAQFPNDISLSADTVVAVGRMAGRVGRRSAAGVNVGGGVGLGVSVGGSGVAVGMAI